MVGAMAGEAAPDTMIRAGIDIHLPLIMVTDGTMRVRGIGGLPDQVLAGVIETDRVGGLLLHPGLLLLIGVMLPVIFRRPATIRGRLPTSHRTGLRRSKA